MKGMVNDVGNVSVEAVKIENNNAQLIKRLHIYIYQKPFITLFETISGTYPY
jgi:hypothetical protein